jgi:uncharacterized membrane protein
MIFWTVLTVLYVLITTFAVYMTYQEQKRQGRSSFLFCVIGYVICAVWPLAVATMCLFAWRSPVAQLPAEAE